MFPSVHRTAAQTFTIKNSTRRPDTLTTPCFTVWLWHCTCVIHVPVGFLSSIALFCVWHLHLQYSINMRSITNQTKLLTASIKFNWDHVFSKNERTNDLFLDQKSKLIIRISDKQRYYSKIDKGTCLDKQDTTIFAARGLKLNILVYGGDHLRKYYTHSLQIKVDKIYFDNQNKN